MTPPGARRSGTVAARRSDLLPSTMKSVKEACMTSVSAGELVGEELSGCGFAERERQLLRHARGLLREGGYDHLTINRLAARSGLSG